jgi:hypothetical protein
LLPQFSCQLERKQEREQRDIDYQRRAAQDKKKVPKELAGRLEEVIESTTIDNGREKYDAEMDRSNKTPVVHVTSQVVIARPPVHRC